jgi:hypothetical protein
MPAATQADFGSHTKDRNVFCDRPYSWLTAPDNLPLLKTPDVTLSEALVQTAGSADSFACQPRGIFRGQKKR